MDRRDFLISGSAYAAGSLAGLTGTQSLAQSTVIAQDSFNPTPNGSLGPNWTDHQTGIPTVINAAGQVTANFQAVGEHLAAAYWSGAFPSVTDYMSEIELVNPTGAGGGAARVGVTVRASGLGNSRSYYEVTMRAIGPNPALPTPPQMTAFNKWVNGQLVLQRNLAPVEWRPGDRMQLCCQGNTIWVQKNGVPLVGAAWSYTDPQPLTSGRPGVTATNTMKGDNWKAYSLGGGGTALPAWVPLPGQVKKVTSGISGSHVTNTFDAVVPVYYDRFYARKMLTGSYSGAVANQYLGSHGALVFRGGGHNANNFNATVALVHNGATAQWVTLSSATPWFGATAASAADNSINPAANDPSRLDPNWCDAKPPLQLKPGAPHSYAMEVIVPPGEGGGTYGSLFEVVPGACNFSGGYPPYPLPNAGSHLFPINSAGGANVDLTNVWARVGGTLSAGILGGGPLCAAYHSAQRRTYYLGRGVPSMQMRWFDHQTNTHVTGTGTSSIPSDGHGFGVGRLLAIPGRNLLLGLRLSSANTLRISYADLTQAEPTNLGDAQLSQVIYLEPVIGGDSPGWAHADYCPLTGKIYLFKTLVTQGGAIDQLGVQTISIPSVLTAQWPVTREAFQSGSAQTAFPVRDNGDFQGPRWLPGLKCFVWVRHADLSASATDVYYYRPVGT